MAVPNSSPLNQTGLILFQHLLRPELIATLRSQIDSKYKEIEDARGSGRSIEDIIGPTEHFLPTASSFTIAAVISEKTVALVLAEIAMGPGGEWIRRELEDEVVCDLDQSWVRRQYAPIRYPRFHAPHGWHQDGALKFNFAAHQATEFPSDALLNMVTCWIALDPCGKDAPGLEIVAEPIGSLFSPTQLTNESVQTRYSPEKFWQPILEPGDALLFRGNYLHRTHVTSTMTNDRTSVELRFFVNRNIPERIQSDRLIELR